MLEYQPGKYIYYLALGYQFKLGDFTLQLDFMERYSAKHNDFDDYSVMAGGSVCLLVLLYWLSYLYLRKKY